MLVNVHMLSFYAAIFFTVVGAVLGLFGVWIKDFWREETTLRLVMTDVIFAVTSIIVAAITKWLSS